MRCIGPQSPLRPRRGGFACGLRPRPKGALPPPDDPLTILDSGTVFVDSTSSQTAAGSHAITVPANTTLLVLVGTAGGDGTNGAAFTDVQYNSVATVSVVNHTNMGLSLPGQQWHYQENPTAGTLNVTFNRAFAMNASAMYWVAFDGTVHEDVIGASEAPSGSGTETATVEDSITAEANFSYLLAAGTVQGEDGDPVTTLHDFTELDEVATGGGSALNDMILVVAGKTTTSKKANSYGFTFATADGRQISAIEILQG